MASEHTWQEIPDDVIRHIWKCKDYESDDCKIEVQIAPEWYTENGTPVCCGCDRDMVYHRTEVQQPATPPASELLTTMKQIARSARWDLCDGIKELEARLESIGNDANAAAAKMEAGE